MSKAELWWIDLPESVAAMHATDHGSTIRPWRHFTSSATHTMLSCLSQDEEKRARSLCNQDRSDRFRVTRICLRRIMAERLQCRPQDVRFAVDGCGKPYIDMPLSSPWYFNLTHSKDRALLAVSQEAEVGVDIEWINDRYNYPSACESLLTMAEQEALSRHIGTGGPRHACAYFYRLWTRKEAVLKALGIGLSINPRTLCVADPSRVIFTDLMENPGPMRLVEVAAPDGYVGALAVRAASDPDVVVHTWSLFDATACAASANGNTMS